jgi:hypothetical protein
MRNDHYTKLPSTKSVTMFSMQPLNTRHASKSWSAVYSAQRHKGARRAGDSRAAEYAADQPAPLQDKNKRRTHARQVPDQLSKDQ